ncbi:MAG: hypothetical protein HC898_04145 [Phycisphaerales bacterium]|nr:hypothetical protein [Phycisphaerales bacterium]
MSNAFDLLAVRQNYLQSLSMITTPAPPLPMTLVTTGFVQTFETLANQPAQPAPVVEQLQVEPVSTPASGASAQIVASFNKTVSVVPQALELVSSIGARVQLPVFRFDTVTRTASWTTAGLTDGRYQGVIRSSGVLSNGVSMLRDFQFRFRLTGSTIAELQVDTSSPGNNGLSV